MFNHVKKIALAASVSMIALSSATYAAEEAKVSNIDVTATMSSSDDGNGMTFYPDIATDIKAAVATRVPSSTDATDPTIRIDVRKITLNGAAMLPETKEFNELEGVVDISSTDGSSSSFSFPIKIAAYSGDQLVPEGYIVVPPSDADFYNAMVEAFANSVADGLENVNTAGKAIQK